MKKVKKAIIPAAGSRDEISSGNKSNAERNASNRR